VAIYDQGWQASIPSVAPICRDVHCALGLALLASPKWQVRKVGRVICTCIHVVASSNKTPPDSARRALRALVVEIGPGCQVARTPRNPAAGKYDMVLAWVR